jgi:ATP-dependent metalloprotease
MDGFEQNEGIIVIAATNIPEQLDPALTRPGRFDRLVHVPNPDIGGRREILTHYLLNKPVDENVDVESIARGTSGFSGAELFNLVNMAAVQAAVSGETTISLDRLEWAKDRIIMGVERKSAVLTEESKKLTAYHEAGHAVVALRTPGAMPVHKATIVPRGNALGMVTQLPDKDETSITRKQLLARLDVCMGGRVAEELIFGKDEVTTGALSDLQQATRLATYMVGEVGLSSLVGPVHVDSMSKGGRRATEALVDKEVVQLLRDSHARVTKLLTKHVADLHALSAEMLARETLTGPEIVRLLGLETKDKEKQGLGKRGRGAPVEKAKEDAGGKEKAKAEERAKAKAGETDGGARAGDDGADEPDADAIPAGILEPVEDRAKASTPA